MAILIMDDAIASKFIWFKSWIKRWKFDKEVRLKTLKWIIIILISILENISRFYC